MLKRSVKDTNKRSKKRLKGRDFKPKETQKLSKGGKMPDLKEEMNPRRKRKSLQRRELSLLEELLLMRRHQFQRR